MSAVKAGTAATTNASRYLQQLCKHWSHKFAVDFDADSGTIELPPGRVDLAATPDRLEVRLTPSSPAEAEADRLRSVVEDHLNRFAFREAPLPFFWTDEDTAS